MDFLDEWFPVLLILIAVVNALTKKKKKERNTQSTGRDISAPIQDVEDKHVEKHQPLVVDTVDVYPETASSTGPLGSDSPEIISDNNFYDMETASETISCISEKESVQSVLSQPISADIKSSIDRFNQNSTPEVSADHESLRYLLQNKQNIRLAVILSEIMNRPYK